MRFVIYTLGVVALLVSGSAMADLALAKKSGCLICHGIDNKIVGPAWKDVAARYKGRAGIKAKLINKIKNGGKNLPPAAGAPKGTPNDSWKAVTGGAPMPSYAKKTTAEERAKLVDFILGL